MTNIKGRFLWYELMTSDPKGALAFYTETINWKTQVWEDSDTENPYTMFMAGDVGIGGVMQLPEAAVKMGAPPHWLPYIGTSDIDATTTKATELGAQVLVPPMDVPNVGRIAVMKDPQGAVFAGYTPASLENALQGDDSPTPGRISWHELMTSDMNAAWSFYGDLFGWEKTESMDMGPAGLYQMYKAETGPTLGGIMNTPAEVPAPPHWLLYTSVEDLDATIDRVKAQGGNLLNGPMDVPGGDRVAQCMDPQGAAFALHSVAK